MNRVNTKSTFLFLALVVLAIATAGCSSRSEAPKEVWTCPMHPEVVADAPGSCPICHMDLVKQEPASAGSKSADPSAEPSVRAGLLPSSNAELVEAKHERVARAVRAAGRVVADERREAVVESRFSGWIAELDADFVGRRVARGAKVATIDSPELYAAESEYLVAREAARRLLASELPEVRRGADDLVLASRRRLELANLPDSRITELERTRVARRTVEIVAPVAGIVVEKLVVRGQRVETGTPLVRLVDLSSVWVEADLYEADAARTRIGQKARLSLAYDPSFQVESAVSFLYPQLATETRTLRARFDVANRDEILRPGMLVDVELALGELEGVVVPDSAVLATGERTIVFVAGADGELVAREIELAGRQAGLSFVRSGLAAGERVAAEASFLVDAESRLRGGGVGPKKNETRSPGDTDPHEGHR